MVDEIVSTAAVDVERACGDTFFSTAGKLVLDSISVRPFVVVDDG